ncbi:MAG: hypothetical protein QW045_01310 [Candidatus Micrarchaeaceae archaeon]
MRIYLLLAVVAVLATMQLGFISAASCINANVGFKVIGVSWGASNSTLYKVNATQAHISAGPGDNYVPLTVSIQSYGTLSNTCSLVGVEGQLQIFGGFSNFNGSNEYPTAYLGQLTPGSTFNMVFYLNIGKKLAAGPNSVYVFPLDLYYNYSNSTLRYSQYVNVGVPLYGSANLTYTPYKKAIGPGLNEFTINVSNTGSGILSNISISASASGGISIISQPQGIAYLAPGKSKNITLELYNPTASGGSLASLILNSHFINPYGYNATSSSTINLYTIQAIQLVSIYPSNQTIIAGKAFSTNMIVHNGNNAAIYNVSISLASQSPLSILGNGSYFIFPYIPANSNASFPIELYSQASSSTPVDSMSAVLAYTLNGQPQTFSKTITFLAPGFINLTQVSLSVLPANPTVGSIFTITPTIDNLGSIGATAASVVAYPPNGINVVGSNSTFIGSIPVATPTAFSLSFIASKAGRYVIPIEIKYLNNLNQHLTADFKYIVNVGSGNYSNSASPAGYIRYNNRKGNALYIEIAVVAAVIIAVGVYAYYLRMRKNRTKRHINESK